MDLSQSLNNLNLSDENVLLNFDKDDDENIIKIKLLVNIIKNDINYFKNFCIGYSWLINQLIPEMKIIFGYAKCDKFINDNIIFKHCWIEYQNKIIDFTLIFYPFKIKFHYYKTKPENCNKITYDEWKNETNVELILSEYDDNIITGYMKNFNTKDYYDSMADNIKIAINRIIKNFNLFQ